MFEEPVEMNLNWKEYDKNRKKSFFIQQMLENLIME
jgi:hypothetical protein